VARFEQFLITVSLPLLPLCWGFPALGIVVVLGLFSLIRRAYLKSSSRPMLSSLLNDFSLVTSLGVMACFVYLQAGASLIGYIIGTWKFRSVAIIPAMTTRTKVKVSITN
jgi:hypothetical protein